MLKKIKKWFVSEKRIVMNYFEDTFYIFAAGFGIYVLFIMKLLDVIISWWVYGIVGVLYLAFIISLIKK